MRRLGICAVLSAGLLLAAAAPALACTRHPTLLSLEGQVMCPTCHTTLDQSRSPAANRIRVAISRWIAGGASSCEIEDRLVSEFGPAILAAPPRRGFGALAWALPLAGLLAGTLALSVAVRRWRGGDSASTADEEPYEDEWLDEELARL